MTRTASPVGRPEKGSAAEAASAAASPAEAAAGSRALIGLPTREIGARVPGKASRWTRQSLRVVLPVAVIVAWQIIGMAGVMPRTLLPVPADVVEGFGELWRNGSLQEALPVSLLRSATGLGIALAIGLTFGFANGLSRLSEQLFDSTLQILRLIPFIAITPLLIAWIGIGEPYKHTLIAVACVFPIYLNTYSAVRLVDPRLVEVGKVFGLGRARTILAIVLPAAWPGILVGLRYSLGISVLALIIAEQTNARSGIGHIISTATAATRLDLIMVGVLIYALLGIAIDVIMRLVEKFTMPWR